MPLCTHPAAELKWEESEVMLKPRKRGVTMVLMQGCANYSYLMQKQQEVPQGGLQSQYWEAQAMRCGSFSTQRCLNQCTLKQAEKTDGSAKGSSTSTHHPLSCTTVYQNAGPGSGRQAGSWGAVGKPHVVLSPAAMETSDLLAPELSLSYHI